MSHEARATPLPTIQALWVRGDFTRMELLSLRSFLAHGHPVDLYTYEPARNIPAGVRVRDAAEILPAATAPRAAAAPFGKGSYGAFSDCFRYHLLEARGGWWSDLDIVCTRPWRFAADALTASTDEPGHGRIANTCVMHFPPHHPLMAACCGAFDRMDVLDVTINETGPLLLHREMTRLGLGHLPVAPSVFCPVPWSSSVRQLLRPRWRRFSLDELKQRWRRPHLSIRFTRETVAVHLWHEMWREAGVAKEAAQPASCLYERLQRQWNPA